MLFIVLFLIAAIGRGLMQTQIDRELSRIRQQDYPADISELNAWYKAPQGPNAASLYEKAFAKMQNSFEQDDNMPVVGRADLPELGQPLPEPMKHAMRGYLSENQQARALLHEAAALQESRYPIDLTAGAMVLLPHLARIKGAVQFLRVDAALAGAEGRTEDAVQAILDSMALANSLEQEPILISWLVRLACQAISILSLEHLLNTTALPPQQIDRLSAVFASQNPEAALERVLAGERCLAMHSLQLMKRGQYKGIPKGPHPLVIVAGATGFWDREMLFHLKILREYVALAKLPIPQQIAAAKVTTAALEQSSAGPFGLNWNPVAGTAISDYGDMFEKGARVKALLNSATIALAVERYRADHDRQLPPNLEALVPRYLTKVLEDPFTANPMTYRKTHRGYIIYSPGANEHGGGGLKKQAFEVTR